MDHYRNIDNVYHLIISSSLMTIVIMMMMIRRKREAGEEPTETKLVERLQDMYLVSTPS